ncbi:MAG: hypothetical protein H0W25_05235 [Acidimicrobiia bacterium]|nr:hypothetical protein [Acidimicrobiia bacterium]
MQPFEEQPVGGPPPTQPAIRRIEAIGVRVRLRAQPRLAIALAAAGCALIVLGVVILGGDNLVGDDGGSGSQLPGIVLSAAVVAGGIALLAKQKEGPLASAGALAAALGVPPLLFFLTFDELSFPPYSTEIILVVSTAAWLGLWLVGPARGRPFFLGAAAIGLWATLLELVEGVFTSPFLFVSGIGASFGGDDFDGAGGDPFLDTPDPATIGVLSLLFGLGYLLLARSWDRSGWPGAATPLTFAALVILPLGVFALSSDLQAVGTGVLAIVVGLAVAAHGATVGRRATTWAGAAGAAAGALVIVFDLLDEPTPAGLGLIVVGAAVVAGAEALRRAVDEPDELTPVASTIGPLSPVSPTAPSAPIEF